MAALFALLLGYFLVYGRVSGVFFGIVTFATTLVLAAFFDQTAGPEWAIGPARFNGYNGMIGIPSPDRCPGPTATDLTLRGQRTLLFRAGAAAGCAISACACW